MIFSLNDAPSIRHSRPARMACVLPPPRRDRSTRLREARVPLNQQERPLLPVCFLPDDGRRRVRVIARGRPAGAFHTTTRSHSSLLVHWQASRPVPAARGTSIWPPLACPYTSRSAGASSSLRRGLTRARILGGCSILPRSAGRGTSLRQTSNLHRHRRWWSHTAEAMLQHQPQKTTSGKPRPCATLQCTLTPENT